MAEFLRHKRLSPTSRFSPLFVFYLGFRDSYRFCLRTKASLLHSKALLPVFGFANLNVHMNVKPHFSADSFCRFSSARDGGKGGKHPISGCCTSQPKYYKGKQKC